MTDTDITTTDQPMIRLDAVTKSYPGYAKEAIRDLSLDINAGEIMVLVGPSGCGKTTTIRLINRLIEPTSGRIFLDGEDVTKVDPDHLRRRIGYVIQQVGLFPHMTIADNIGLIPHTLGWDKDRIRNRVDELLNLVGLDSQTYRSRYPKQLSGGQQQRVGVARALAADPPVMLMDEPFGAIDPITRDRLQDEFLRLQERIRKTIVFVTHDIQEAVKLGDRIAIFDDNGKVAQLDTPARILTKPADDFVASFIGSGAAVRGLGLERIDTLALQQVSIAAHSTHATADSAELGRALIVDDQGRPQRWAEASPDAGNLAVVRGDQTLYDALDAMLRARDDTAVVTDSQGRVIGQLPWRTVIRRTGPKAHDRSTVSSPSPSIAGGL